MTRSLSLSALALAVLAACTSPLLAGDCCDEKKESVAAKTPQECFEAVCAAMHGGDLKGLFAQMSVKSQELATKKGEEMRKACEACADTQEKLNITADQAKELSGGELSMAMMVAHVKEMAAKAGKEGCEEKEGCDAEAKKDAECCEKCELADLKIDGDKATAKCPLGFPLTFVRENEVWKMDITAMMEGGCDKGGCDESKAKE
jgi:hypothetical protein